MSLLERVRAFEPSAWQRLSRIYTPLVYGWCRRTGLQDCDAADVCQEVFRAVAKDIDRFRRDEPGHSFRGWMWTITRNKVRDLARRNRGAETAVGGSAGRMQLDQLPAELPETDPSDASATNAIAHRALKLVREEFESTTWDVFRRVTMDGQRPTDVADEFGMTLGAVCTAKWRVLKRLREEMDGLW